MKEDNGGLKLVHTLLFEGHRCTGLFVPALSCVKDLILVIPLPSES